MDFENQEFIVITSPASGNPTAVTKDPEPSDEVIARAVEYLQQFCMRLWGPNIDPIMEKGNGHGGATFGHWRMHARRERPGNIGSGSGLHE